MVVVVVFIGVQAIALLLVAVPIPGRDSPAPGWITDIGPLNSGETSLNQRDTVETADGQRFIVDVAHYPTCRIGSRVTLHRRQTMVGVVTSVWPEGCR